MALPADQVPLKAMWDEAAESFRKHTGKSLQKPVSLDNALSTLNAKLNPADSETGEKQKKVKTAATNIVKLIHLLGGLAAQGASIVFGPADMCFNALQFLLDIPAKIAKVWDDLAKLLDDVSTFMKQFKIYQDIEKITALDTEFRQSVHRLLVAFVDICGIAFKVCDKRAANVFKRLTKTILFDDDDGVVGALEHFRQLSIQHNSISGAVTLKHVIEGQSETTGTLRVIFNQLNESAEANSIEFRKVQEGLDKIRNNTDVVVKDVSDRKDKEAKLESIRKLRIKLGLPESIEKADNPITQLRTKLIEDTGSWLDDLPEYQKWLDMKNSEQKVLVLKGKPSSGRSFLLAKIHDDLDGLQEKAIRLFTVAYTFEVDDKASTKTNQAAPVIQALKQIAVQLASADEVFMKLLGSQLDKTKGQSHNKDAAGDNKGAQAATEKSPEISKALSNLFSGNTMRSQSSSYYVLLLDGIDQLPYQVVVPLFNALLRIETDQLKIVLTATPDTVNGFPEQSTGRNKVSYTTIEIEANNHEDIRRFVKHEIDDPVFSSNVPAMKTIIEELTDKVPDLAMGSYRNANLIVENVREAIEAEKDLKDILDLISAQTLDNPDSICQKTIRELERSLSSQEIEQLNELLIWTIYGYRYFTIPEMRSVLFLLMKKTMFTDLREKINSRFAKILTISGEMLYMKDYEMSIYFNNVPRLQQLATGETGSDEPRISMQITISNAKISQVQRFFWDLSEKIVLDKMDQFTFTNLNLDLEKNVKGSIVSANPIDGRLAILRSCFDLLLGEDSEETSSMNSYATGYLLYHLPEFETDEQKAEFTTEERQYIAEQLILVLENPDNIEAHLTRTFFEDGHLLEDLAKVENIFSDSVAITKLRVRQRKWLKTVLTAGVKTVLRDIAIMVARLWLFDRKWDALLPFSWLSRYYDYLDTKEEEPEDINTPYQTTEESETQVDGETANGETVNGETANGETANGETTNEETVDEEKVDGEDDNSMPENSTGPETSEPKQDPEIDGESQKSDSLEESAATDTTSPEQPPGAVDVDSPQQDVPEATTKVQDRIATILKWVQDELEVSKKSYLWYERVGFTYLAREDDDSPIATAGKEAFLTARSMTAESSWRIAEGLSRCYYHGGEIQLAIKEVGTAISLLDAEKRDEAEETRLLENRLKLADWLIESKQVAEGVNVLRELVKGQPDNALPHKKLFKTLCESDMDSDAVDFLQSMVSRQWKDSKRTELCHYLLSCCGEPGNLDDIKQLLAFVKERESFDTILEALNDIYASLTVGKISDEHADKLQTIAWSCGFALTRCRRSTEHIELALPYLLKTMELGFDETQEYERNSMAFDAAKNYISIAFSESVNPEDMLPDSTTHRSEIITVLQNSSDNTWFDQNIRRLLIAYYIRYGKKDEADRLVRLEVQNAFGLLDDREPENDNWGYWSLGIALLHAGDDQNASIALSLYGPQKRHDETSTDDDIGLTCDGDCGGLPQFTWSSVLWMCKICDDMGFCESCFGKLRDGSLKKPSCSQDHEWLLIGNWQQEFEATGKDKVRTGVLSPSIDRCQHGKRVGEELTPISEWLDTIRKQWNIEKPPPWPYTTLVLEKETIFEANQEDTFLVADFTNSGQDDLVRISSAGGENVKIEVTYAKSGYQEINYKQTTAFRSEEQGTWSIMPSTHGDRPDLYLIKKNGPSGKIEIHMASGASNYQRRSSKIGTYGCDNNGVWMMCDFTGSGQCDVAFIRTSASDNDNIEIHVASAKSDYQEVLCNTGTMFSQDLGQKGTWILRPWSEGKESQPDLVFVESHPETAKGKVELNISPPDYYYSTFKEGTVFGNRDDGIWTMSASKAQKPDLIFIQTKTEAENGKVKIFAANG